MSLCGPRENKNSVPWNHSVSGVSFMATAESYVFRSFLKTIILVVTLGALHGLVILPVLLTLFYCDGRESGDE